MKHLIRAQFLLLAMIANFSLFAQGPNNSVKVPPVIPPSPDVAALGKYGSIPIGLHTGTPNIDIPLYTIKAGDLTLPISLSYHASGNKVAEVASWVGLGWVLNADGVVSRSVVGRCDLGGFWAGGIKSFQQIDIVNDHGYLKSVADNIAIDGESDLYFYNFNGRSGKFVYRQNQGSTNPQLIPESPLKVEFVSGSFQITDESGMVYKFGHGEQMSDSETSQTFESSYRITEIVSADGMDRITFSYVNDNSYTEFNWVYTETIGQQCAPGAPGIPSGGYYNANATQTSRLINSSRLTAINFPNGKVEFIPDYTRSDLPAVRLQEVKISSKNRDGSFTHQKSYVLGEDYFVAPTGAGKDKYRLKLTGVTEKDANNVISKLHSFHYDETTLLPHRTSLAQDWWGYYNGQTGNTSLIPSENINFLGHGYVVGAGNRDPNALTMQAGILKKIIYPTGGSTELDYESHSYAGGTTTSQLSTSASSGAIGNTTSLLQQTVTFTPLNSGWARVVTFCSNVTDAVPFFSSVTVKKQGESQYALDHRYDPAIYSPYNPELSKEFLVFLVGGSTYELTVMSKGNSTSTLFSGAAFSQAQVYWYQTTAGTSTLAGGLRVKETRDYAKPGASPVKKIYKYGNNEIGHGVLLIPPYGLSSSKQEIDFIYSEVQLGPTGQPLYCTEFCRGQKLVITGRPALDLTTLGGSSVVYEQVTVYENDVSSPNGKQILKFSVQIDETTLADKAYNNGRFQLSDNWKGGDEVLNTVYKGASTKVKETSNANTILKPTTTFGTKVGWATSFEGCGFPAFIGNTTCCNDVYFYLFDYPMYSGVKKLMSTKETQYSSTDPTKSIETQVDYHYDNTNTNHQQLSRRIILDSEGNTHTTRYWYPADYTNVGEITPLMTKNIIGVPIKEETHRQGLIIDGKVTRLNSDGKPIEVYKYESITPQTPPTHVGGTIVPSGYVKKLDMTYDGTTKKLTKTQLTDNHSTAYLWGHNNTFPTAMVANATDTEVAATSFESDGKGNWTYTGPVYNDIAVKTGTYYYRLGGGSITRSLAVGKYKLEYWGKGTINLSGGTITTIRTSPADANGWILYEKEVNINATTTLTISGTATAYVDELRIYPTTAQMTTYTYDVEKGITTSSDPNNVTSYYEYDSFGRFRFAKDQYGNIVKGYEYHYKGY